MKCPHCRKEISLHEIQCDEEWREILGLQQVFGKHSRLVMEYCEKFSATPIVRKSKKLSRLLREVGALFVQKKFQLGRLTYEVSEAGIVEGLTIVCNKEFESSLENHNYLKKVLASISEREQKEQRDTSDKAQRRREEVATKTRRHEEVVLNDGNNLESSRLGGGFLSPEEIARRARELGEKIGKKMEEDR